MHVLTALALVAYGVSAALYLVFVASGRASTARAGRFALTVAVAAHLVEIGWRCARMLHPVASASEAMAFVAFLIAGAFLIGSRRRDLAAAGSFAVPGALVLLVLARFAPNQSPGAAASGLGVTHVLLATTGLGIFAIAAVLAALYLWQERKLKTGQFGQLVGRGPALETLDRLASRCVTVGFPVFTVALVTGALWIARLGGVGAGAIRPEYLLAAAAWIAFGVLIVARLGVGWRGRKAAWLTLGGFGSAMLVLLAYLARQGV